MPQAEGYRSFFRAWFCGHLCTSVRVCAQRFPLSFQPTSNQKKGMFLKNNNKFKTLLVDFKPKPFGSPYYRQQHWQLLLLTLQ